MSSSGMKLPDSPGRVLVLRTDKIGDMILSTPALRCIRHSFPEAEITLVASTYNAPVVGGCPHVDHVLQYDRNWSHREKWGFIREIRKSAFDLAIVLSPVTASYVIGFLSGASVRIGIVYWRRILVRALSGILLTHAYIPDRDISHGGMPHEVEQMMGLLSGAGMLADPGPTEVYPSHSDHAWAQNRLARNGDASTIALHLSAKWFTDGWSAGDVASLAAEILNAFPDSKLVLTYGPGEAEYARDLECRGLDKLSVELIGDMQFGQWAALYSMCSTVISPDTGALHLASAVGRPVVGLYSVNTYDLCSRQWSPWQVPHITLPLGTKTETIPLVIEHLRGMQMNHASDGGC